MTDANKGTLYAVYGTLRKGFGNYRYLLSNPEEADFIGEMKTEPKFKMVSLSGFPGVIVDSKDGKTAIVVEIFRVKTKELERRLDNLEGYPHFYNKTQIDTAWGKANMYILPNEKYGDYKEVVSGDWKQYISERK